MKASRASSAREVLHSCRRPALAAADSVRASMGNVSARANDRTQMVTEPTEAIKVPSRRRIEAV